MLTTKIRNGLNSFTRSDILNYSENPLLVERVVIAGFLVFSVTVLTTYSATSENNGFLDKIKYFMQRIDAATSKPDQL